MGLLRLDVVHGILGSSAPTLDDDGEQEDDEACRAGNSEYPGAERDAIGEVREPVAHDIIGDRHGDDERHQHGHGEGAEHQQQHLARRRSHHLADGYLLLALADEEERQPHRLAVGSTVSPYTTAAMANISHATQVLTLENVVCCIILRKFCFAKVATIN